MPIIIELHFTILELILWVAGISAGSFITGALALLIYSAKSSKKIEVFKLQITPKINFCSLCGALRVANGKWLVRCPNSNCNDYQPI